MHTAAFKSMQNVKSHERRPSFLLSVNSKIINAHWAMHLGISKLILPL